MLDALDKGITGVDIDPGIFVAQAWRGLLVAHGGGSSAR
jgi:hypothetical protein